MYTPKVKGEFELDCINLGIIAEWIGGRALVGYTLILSSIFTAVAPMAAESENFWLLFATRFIVGVFGVKYCPPTNIGEVSAVICTKSINRYKHT